jgi:2-amino-4-hydroxy-6-hydroxymethyldihydropteridine diphosphokinase
MVAQNSISLWRPAYVALGSNLGRPRERVREALERLRSIEDTRLEAVSRLYETAPLGPQDQPDFVNAVAGVITLKSPHGLLEALLAVERTMGRIRAERWGPRVIDLDLVWMVGGLPMAAGPMALGRSPALELPHPGVSRRNFVLYPLCDIAPTLDIPGLGRVLDLKARVAADGISVVE